MLLENLENQNLYRLIVFAFGFVLFFFLGLAFSYRRRSPLDRKRWVNNSLLTAVNTILVKALFPIGLVAYASSNQFGLFYYLDLPFTINVLVSVFVLDLVIYLQHLVFHYQPLMWRLHAVHHTDVGFDVTTALRFHPIEIGLSVLIKFLFIFLLGIHPLAVLIFEILLNFSAMFNHSNFSLPTQIEKLVSKIVVTPDFHRIHHSRIQQETNSNFGFCLSIWDRMFKTYNSSSKNDLKLDVIGLEYCRDAESQRFDKLLLQPFKNRKSSIL